MIQKAFVISKIYGGRRPLDIPPSSFLVWFDTNTVYYPANQSPQQMYDRQYLRQSTFLVSNLNVALFPSLSNSLRESIIDLR